MAVIELLCVSQLLLKYRDMERKAKLQKLNHFRRAVPFVSQRALEAIFELVRKDGLPELQLKKHMHETTEATFAERSQYGELVTTHTLVGINGANTKCVGVNPLSYMHAAFSQGGSYTDLACRTLSQKGCSPEKPWQLIVYTDEIDPGDPLAPRGHTRKVWSFYFAFVEFGLHALSKEEAWLTCEIARTVDVDSVAAGAFCCMLCFLSHAMQLYKYLSTFSVLSLHQV